MIFPSAFRALVNRFSLTSALLVFLFQTALVGASNLPSAADGFDPNVSGNVYALAQQADGKLIVGGSFGIFQANGGTQDGRNNIARIGIDGSVDATFNPNANGQINAVLIQTDGKIIIGGTFTAIGTTTRNYIARLNADGSLDSTFNPNANGNVNSLALQSDGKVLVGGAFTTIGGATRNRIARLSTAGVADAFDPNASNVVNAIAVQINGQILIGGGFTTLQPNGAAATTARNRAARLNADGSVDTVFDPNTNNLVSTIAVQLDGKIILGGSFTTVQPNGTDTATTRNHIVRFTSDGTLDTFDPNASGNVGTIALQSDGKILIGGTFTTLRPLSASVVGRNYFARLNIDGSVDTTFNAGPNSQVSAVIVQADGSIVLGGYFTQLLSGSINTIATLRNRLARVNANGLLDITFDPNARGAVISQLVLANGQVMIGGTFSSVGGTTRNFLARLTAAGALDTTYDPNPNGAITTMVQQSDGKVIVGGSFTTISGDTRNYIARLNPDGSTDGGFNPNLNSTVTGIIVQSDGKILVCGAFTTAQPNGAGSAITHPYLLRLNADGSLDTPYSPAPNAQIAAMVLQSDNKLVVGGSFSAFQPNSAPLLTGVSFLARVNNDGTLDGTYLPTPNSSVSALALQSDGKIIAGGSFTTWLPSGDTAVTDRKRLARITTAGKIDSTFDPSIISNVGVVNSIVVQSNQQIVVGGAFSALQPNSSANYVTRNNLVRLNTDGNVDTTFDPNLNGVVRSVVLLSDQRLLLGGAFSTLQPNGATLATARFHSARLAVVGTVDTTFDPSVGGQAGGQVSAVAVQSNGRFLVAGGFGDTGGSSSSNISRFNPDSTPDAAFSPDADGPINTIAVRPNSEALQTQAAGFAYLNADGSFRPGFITDPNVRLVGTVYATATQSDGKVIVGGAFVNSTGATNKNLLRFLPNGTLDSTYNPSPDGSILSITIQSNDSILVGGTFTNIGGSARNHVARLDGGGTADTFDPNANGTVFAIAIQADGKILLGGNFTSLQPNSTATSTARNYLARVNADGTLDTGYTPSPNAQVTALAIQSDTKAVIAGSFTTVAATATATTTIRNYIARINNDGTLDTGFDPNSNAPIAAIAIQSDGSVIMGGSFTSVGGWDTPYINRTNSSGANDATFGHRANGPVNTIALQADGRTVIGGAFTTFDNVPRNRLVRLNADNTLDTAFNPNADSAVTNVVVRADGAILLSGSFTTLRPLGAIYAGGSFANIGSAQLNNLALINDDGSASTNFRPNPNGAVNAVTVQPDGRALVGGSFTTIFGAVRNRLARLTADGSLDLTYNPNSNASVTAIALQVDGKVVVGGAFTTMGGAARNRIARLNADGSLDSFNPNADAAVNVVAVQADGKLIVGGAFTSIGGAARSRLARLNTDGSADSTFNPGVDGTVSAALVQADGKVIVGGAFATVGGAARSNLARLNADGSVDASFDPGADGAVLALGISTDGKLLVGGAFTRIAGLARYRFARLAPTALATQTLGTTTNMTAVLWTRGGGAPELSGVIFDQSSDATTWTTLGQGTRVGTTSNWQLAGVSLPSSTNFYLRARGVVPSSQAASSGLTETVRWLTPAPVVTSPTVVGGAIGSTFYYAVSSASGANSYSASGLPVGLSIDPVTGIISGTPTVAGTYTVVVTATNIGGTTTTSLTIAISASSGSSSGSRLISLSARAQVTPSNPLIAGFVIGGTEAKSVLLRGVGPGLATTFNLPGVLTTPEIRLFNSSGQLILSAGTWGGSSSLAATFAAVGAFPLVSGSADSATVATLQPGVYTMQVVDPHGIGGIALAEIYDVTPGATPRLVEISARSSVSSGGSVLIGGLVISGPTPKKVLLRGVGSTLAALGVGDSLPDPTLSLFNSQSQVIASNDNWGTPVTVNATYPAATAAAISTAAASSGAFPLPPGSTDSSLIVTLPAGNYTVQLAGVNNATGVALVEIYELP